MPVVLGIDPSLTSCGWCVIKGDRFEKMATGTFGYALKAASERDNIKRLTDIVSEILRVVDNYDPEIVGIENYAFSRVGSLTNLAELVGILKYTLTLKGLSPYMVGIHESRKFVLGVGYMKKVEVVARLVELGIQFKTTDAMDAWFVAKTMTGVMKPAGLLPTQIEVVNSLERKRTVGVKRKVKRKKKE